MESGPGGPQPWGHLQLSLHYDLGSQKVRPRGAVGWWWVPGAGCRADRVLGTGGPWLSPSWLPDQGGPQAGGGPEGPGPGRHSRPLRLRPPLPRGWAQARDKGAPRHALPRVRRDLQLPGECGPAGGRRGGGGGRLTRPPPAELPGAALLVHVRDSQRFSRHEPLGTLRLPLAAVDPQPVLELWLPLGPPGSAEVKPLTRRLRPGPGH